MVDLDRMAVSYIRLKNILVNLGYADEIDWQDRVSFDSITQSKLFSEIAWVIISGGLSFYAAFSVFPKMKESFYDWDLIQVTKEKEVVRKQALEIFGHERKVDAILSICELVDNIGYQTFKTNISIQGIDYLKQLPHVGPVTAYHLAKNIGINVVKPDRHLERIAKALNYSTPTELCWEIAKRTNDKVSVVDIVLWRFATINTNYIDSIKRHTLLPD